MWETIAIVLKIGLGIFLWIWGNKVEREKREKEIVDNLRKIKKDGDVLADRLHKEMLQHSETDWDDIKPRNPNG